MIKETEAQKKLKDHIIKYNIFRSNYIIIKEKFEKIKRRGQPTSPVKEMDFKLIEIKKLLSRLEIELELFEILLAYNEANHVFKM